MTSRLSESVARLRSLRRPARAAHTVCELCGTPIAAEHPHVVERSTGRLSCACGACALLFRQAMTQRYCSVPRDLALLDGFRMSDNQWQNLAIPISLAFLFESTRAGRVVAVYPSPAGGTESTPMLEAWEAIVAQNPVLHEFDRDVEALLVNRIDGARDYFRVPIDQCYELVGRVRLRWRGFTGGVELWNDIHLYFASLKAKAHRCST